MKKLLSIFTIIIFFAFICVPLVFFNFKKEQVSSIDNRALMEWSEVGKKSSFSSDMESYLTDRIGFRNTFLNSYLSIHESVFHVLSHPTYTYGKEEYVFFQMKPEILDEPYLNTFANYIEKIQNYCKERNTDFLYCINPPKTAVYHEYLPNGVDYKNVRFGYLKQLMDQKEISYIDNTQALIEAKKTTQVFNQKFDAGHWNDAGAFVGFQNIINTLQTNHPTIPSLTKDLFEITTIVQPYLPLSHFKINEEVPVYTLKNESAIRDTSLDQYIKLDATQKDFTRYINKENKELPKLLVFRGSYFLEKEKFMKESFSEITCVHSYKNIANFEYYFNLFQPDIVLFESVDYATTNHYFPKEPLDQKQLNPSYDTFKKLPEIDENQTIQTNFKKKLQTELENKTDSPLITVSTTLSQPVSNAYVKVDEQIYDITLKQKESAFKASITLLRETLEKANSIELILISEDGKKQMKKRIR